MKHLWKKLAVCMIAMALLVPVRAVFAPDVSAEAAETFTLVLKDTTSNNTITLTPYLDSTINFSNYNMSKTGYTFDGWNTKEDGSGTTYTGSVESSVLTTTANTTVTLYAKYTPYVFYLVLDGNGSTSGSYSGTYWAYVGKSSKVPTNVYERTGYTFAGWNNKADGSGTSLSDGGSFTYKSSTNGDTFTLYAQWTPITYTVRFDGNANGYTEGSMSDMKLTYDTASTLTANSLTYYGYTFAGWNTASDGSGTTYKDGASVKNLTTTNGAIVTLYAGWYPNYYYLNLDGNGSTSGSYSGKYWGYTDVNYDLPANVYERTGYTFAGWNTKKDGSGNSFADKENIYGIAEYDGITLSLYAQWQPITYSIAYQLDGGTNSNGNPSSYTIESTNITLSNPTKNGYLFLGWYSDAAFTTAVSSIKSGSYGDRTLYAKWGLIDYTITYTLNGGTNSDENPDRYSITQKITLAKPTREGYTFGGWYSDKNFTTKVTSIKEGSTGDKTLYAKWNENTYTIVFNGNGSTKGSMSSLEALTYSKSYKLTKNKFTKKDYTFAGWNTKKDGSGESYKDGASVKKLTVRKNGKVTLYAQWKSLHNAITYVLDGGTNSSGNPDSYTYGKAVTLKAPTRAGYTFQGWYTDKKFKNKVTSIKKGSSGDKTLYAKWKANTYTIVYDGNGSTGGSMSSKKSLAYSKSYTLTKNKFTRTGYTFAGWNTKKDGKGTSYKNAEKVAGLVTKNKGRITLYAQWKAGDYTITYQLNGGTNSSRNPDSYTYGKAVTLKAPTRDGYTFQGWYTDKNLTKKITSVSAKTSGNLVLYAGWKKAATTCPTCDGKKTVSCKKCDNGKVICSSCGGNGFTIVPGQGKVDCTVCGATGKIDCTTCGGDGKVTCSTCDGKGTVTN